MKKRKGLLVSVLRREGQDCTAKGITSQVSTIILYSEDVVLGPCEIDEGEIYLELVTRNINGTYLHAKVMKDGNPMGEGTHVMAGGNFIYSSDSRFPNRYPISVHDRFEKFH